MTTASLEILKTRSATDRQALNIASENLALASVDGHTQKDVYVKRLSTTGALTGVSLSDRIRRFDPLLQSECYKGNSDLSHYQTTDKVLQQINFMFGSKGGEFSFSSDLAALAQSFYNAGNSADPYQKSVVVNNAVQLSNNLTNMTNQLQTIKTQSDSAMLEAVNAINGLLQRVSDLNTQIVNTLHLTQDATDLQDQRDLAIHELSAYVDIDARLNPNSNIMVVSLRSGDTILNGQIVVGDSPTIPVSFTFTPTVIASPGAPVNPVMLGTLDVTNRIKGGVLGGLIESRDSIIPNLQAELDELTRNMRDQINAIHNQGTSSTGQSTLTGTAGFPGLGGPMVGTETISGTGTIRLAVLNQGGIVDYKDVVLTDGMTVNDLLNTINAVTPYGIGNAAGAFTASLTPQGQLQIAATTPGYSVAIGSTNNSAQLSFTPAYDPTQSYGFSHFFGMNNFFNTGNKLASPTAQVGITNFLSVNPTYIANPNLITNGALSTVTPAPTNTEGALGGQDTSILSSIYQTMTSASGTFLASGVLPQTQISLLKYSAQIISVTESQIKVNSDNVKSQTALYQNLSKANSDFSASNPESVLMTIVDITSSQLLVTKAISMILSMEQKISDILSR